MTLDEMISDLDYVVHKSQMATLELGDEGARQLLRWLEDYKELKEHFQSLPDWLPVWVSCDEAMPQEGLTVLIIFENTVEISALDKSGLGFLRKGEFIGKNLVTHWMPLPEMPKGEER